MEEEGSVKEAARRLIDLCCPWAPLNRVSSRPQSVRKTWPGVQLPDDILEISPPLTAQTPGVALVEIQEAGGERSDLFSLIGHLTAVAC